jgi:hypothetical protein
VQGLTTMNVEPATGYNGGLDDDRVPLPSQADAIVRGIGGTSVIDKPNPSGGADLMQVRCREQDGSCSEFEWRPLRGCVDWTVWCAQFV